MSNFSPPDSLASYVGEGQQLFGYEFTLYPGRAEALSQSYAGHKYGDATTWSLSCDDIVGFNQTTEDSGSHFFDPTGSLLLTYGVANSSTTARFGNTSLFFPASGLNEYMGRILLPTGSGGVAAYTNFSFEFWVNVPDGGWPLVFAGVGWPSITLTPVANTWHHFAFCRKSNILRAFSNGVKVYEALSTGALSITGFGDGGGTNAGHAAFYLDSIGFSNNYAHYDGVDFTPQNVPFYNVPTSVGARMELVYSLTSGEASGTRITPVEADGQWDKTVLLIQGRGPVGSKAIADAKGRKLFNQADTVYSDVKSRNGETSLYFNGTSAKLAIEPSRNLDLIDGDFTIEMWLNPSTIRASSLVNRWGDTTACFALHLNSDGTILFNFWDAASSTTTSVSGPSAIAANVWSFISVCRSANDYRVSVNGTGGTIVTTTKTPWREASRMFQGGGYSGDFRSWDTCLIIGANAEDGAYPGSYYHGFMEDLRITNGFARYQALDVYATPVTAFLPSGSGSVGDPYWYDVVLLAHFDEPNGTVTGIREAKGHTLTISGAGYVTENGQYGGGYKNTAYNAGGGLTVPYGSEFDFSAGDFTYEAWVSDLGSGSICSNTLGGGGGWQLDLLRVANPSSSRSLGVMQWSQSDSNNTQDIALSVLYPFYGERSRWHHIAVVRNGNYITLYVDGIGATTNITRRPKSSTNAVRLTGFGNGNYETGAFGRYEEIRITRVARYTQDFKPPTAKFPEVAFSYGNAVITEFYGFIPGSVKAASTVPGAIATTTYSVSPPLIIGLPKVVGPTFDGYEYSVLPPIIKGGEGIPEAMAFSDTLNARLAFTHTQNVRFTDEVIAQAVRNLASRFAFGGSATAMLRSVQLSDGLTFQSALPPVRLAVPISEVIEVSSSAVPALGVILAAQIGMADAPIVARGQVLSEVIALSMPVGPTSHRLVTTDNIAMTGTSAQAAHGVAADTLALAETTATKANFTSSLTDAVAFNDTPSLTLILTVTVAEDIALNDIPAQQLLFSVIMQEGMQFSTLFTSPVVTAWAMNVRNAAVTQYSNFQYNSFAKMGERYLGANDQGLWWMDGTLDGIRPVNSRITTGIIQPNGNKLAGVQYAYLGMRGTGQFTVTVTDEAGSSYNYTLNAVDMETSRVVFGRGFRTRYFTFSLESKGQDFDLDNIEFVTSDISRKLQR